MEQENKIVETDTTVVDNKTATAPTASISEPETQDQINWRQFREVRKVERQEKLAAEKKAAEKEAEAQALKAAMEAILNKPAHATTLNNNFEEDLSEDDRIQRKVEAAIAERERKSEEARRIKEQQEFPKRLTSTYKDFDQVCTSDNLDYLEYHYPEVAEAYKNSPDGFDKWSSIYRAVKRFVPNTDSKKEQSKAEKNFAKPQAMSIPGKTQVGDTAPHSLDDKKRSDNWARMQRVMRGG
jgi:hypothetical protein